MSGEILPTYFCKYPSGENDFIQHAKTYGAGLTAILAKLEHWARLQSLECPGVHLTDHEKT